MTATSPLRTAAKCSRGWRCFATWSTYVDEHKPRSPPLWGFKRRLCWGDVPTTTTKKKITVERRNAYGLAGSAWSDRRWRLHQISHADTTRWACPQMSPDPLLRDHGQPPRQPLGSLWSLCDWMTKVERIINDSDLVLAFSHHISFIHTSYSDEQCITQKYKGKILVLHYTFSKIYTE